MGFLRWLLADDWEKRRKHDLGPYYQDQLDEIRRLYPREADEIILKEHRRLGFSFSGALNAEAQRIQQQRMPAHREMQEVTMTLPALRFNKRDFARAKREWDCSCVPVAFAAVFNLTLDETRPFFPGFKGWATEDMVTDAINWTGRWWRNIGTNEPRPYRYGLVRLGIGRERFHRIATWNDGFRFMAADSASLAWLELGRWKREVLPKFKPTESLVYSVIEVGE